MKWLHNILKGISLTGAFFVFQACYGTPRSEFYHEHGEAPMTFSVVSRTTGEPLKGIRILSSTWDKDPQKQEVGITGDDGKCRVSLPYVRNMRGPFITLMDPENQFQSKDTTLADLQDREVIVKLYPKL